MNEVKETIEVGDRVEVLVSGADTYKGVVKKLPNEHTSLVIVDDKGRLFYISQFKYIRFIGPPIPNEGTKTSTIFFGALIAIIGVLVGSLLSCEA